MALVFVTASCLFLLARAGFRLRYDPCSTSAELVRATFESASSIPGFAALALRFVATVPPSSASGRLRQSQTRPSEWPVIWVGRDVPAIVRFLQDDRSERERPRRGVHEDEIKDRIEVRITL